MATHVAFCNINTVHDVVHFIIADSEFNGSICTKSSWIRIEPFGKTRIQICNIPSVQEVVVHSI